MRDRLIAGAMPPASLVVKAQKFRRWYRDEVLKLFDEVDAILAPATPCTAPLIGQQTFMLGDVEMPVRANLGIYTQPISFIGLPVVAVPVPLAPLPIGVQIIAAPWREDVALRIAHALETKGVVGATRPQRSKTHTTGERHGDRLAGGRRRSAGRIRALREGLVSNDVATLDAIFRDDPRTIRYGGSENFTAMPRSTRFAPRARRLVTRTLSKTVISTYGRDFAVASTLFHRPSCPGKSAGRCRPGCGFRKAGAWSPRMSA